MLDLATPITIRLAARDDQRALARLAALDSAERVPGGRLVLAEVAGELRAALSLHDGSTIADPFYPTAQLVDLLRAFARRSVGPRRRRRRLRASPTARITARGPHQTASLP